MDASGSYARQRESENQPVLGLVATAAVRAYRLKTTVYQAGFDASWEIDVFGGTRRATESARAQVAAAQFGEREVLVTLLGEVARNYVEARGYQRRLEIARDNIRAQEQSLAIVQNRFTNGLTSDLDVQQASTVLATTRAVVPALETALAASIHRLGVLLGQTPESLETELAAVAPIPAAPPVVPVGLPSELLLRRPDVALAERQLAAATANIGVAKADLFPKFYLTGVAGFEGISADDWFKSGSRFWSVGPAVQWRIFDAGRIRANIKVQNARQEQALASYENTALSAFEDVENALTAYAKEQIRRQSVGGRGQVERGILAPGKSTLRQRPVEFHQRARRRALAVSGAGRAGAKRPHRFGKSDRALQIARRRMGNAGPAAAARAGNDSKMICEI